MYGMRTLSTIEEETGSLSASSTDTKNTLSKKNSDTKINRGVRACQIGDIDVVRFLLNGQIDVNQLDDEECSMLHWAAINNQVNIILLLLSRNANINMIGGILKATPLHWACHVSHLEAVVTLVQKGADASIRNVNGETPLHIAATTGNSMIIAYLMLKFGNIKDLRDNEGQSAVIISAKNGYGQFPLSIFCQLNAYLDFIDDANKETALHITSKKKNVKGVVELLLAEANTQVEDKNGNLPMDYFNEKAQKAIWNFVKDRKLKRDNRIYKRICSRSFIVQLISALLPALLVLTSFLIFRFFPFYVGIICSVLVVIGSLLYQAKNPFETMYWFPSMYIATMGLVEISILLFQTEGILPWYCLLTEGILFAVGGICFWILILFDNGKVVRSTNPYPEFIANVETSNCSKYCFTCWVPRPVDSHHCSICDKCVLNFDHHCPWLNRCIYRKNFRLFIFFIITATLFCILYIPILGYYVVVMFQNIGAKFLYEHCFILSIFLLSIVHCGGALNILYVQMSQIARSVSTIQVIRNRNGTPSPNGSPYENRNKISFGTKVGNICRLLIHDKMGDDEVKEGSQTSSTSSTGTTTKSTTHTPATN